MSTAAGSIERQFQYGWLAELRVAWRTLALALRAVTRWQVLLCAFYLGAGVFWADHQVFLGDALSRVAIARGVIQGFDPGGETFLGLRLHAAAIGFVWGPLVSGLEIPLLIFDGIFPWLSRDGYAGVIVTAPFMTWGMWQLDRLLLEQGFTRAWRVLLTAGLALNPVIIIFASNGMSEAPYVALMLACVRYLLRWQRSGHVSDLAIAGIFLGMNYLVRYETPAAGIAGCAFVFLHVMSSEQGTRRERIRRAAVDMLIFIIPLAFVMVTFSGISWWVTGSLLAQFQSQYGTAAQQTSSGVTYVAPVSLISTQLLLLGPTLPAMLPIGGAIHHLRRGTMFPVLMAILVAPLAFDVVEISKASILDDARYMILAVPLAILLLGLLKDWGRLGFALAVVGVVGIFGSAILLSRNEAYGTQEYPYTQAVLGHSNLGNTNGVYPLAPASEVAEWLDSQSMPNGSILVDAFQGFSVVLESNDPQRFVTTPFQGFPEDVYAPYQHHIKYIVVEPPSGLGSLDAINRYYPGLYEGCVKGTQLALAVDSPLGQWRVYELLAPIAPSSLQYNGNCVLPSSTVGIS